MKAATVTAYIITALVVLAVTGCVTSLLNTEKKKKRAIAALMGKERDASHVVDALMSHDSIRAKIISRLGAEIEAKALDILRERVPFTIGRTSFSETIYQEFTRPSHPMADPEVSIAVLSRLLGQKNMDLLAQEAKCNGGESNDFCTWLNNKMKTWADTDKDRGKKIMGATPPEEYCIKKKDPDGYLIDSTVCGGNAAIYEMLTHADGVSVIGNIDIHMYLSPEGTSSDPEFYIEGEGSFYSVLNKYDAPIVHGMFSVVSHGPYDVEDVLSNGYIDVGIRAISTTLHPPGGDTHGVDRDSFVGQEQNVLYRIKLNAMRSRGSDQAASAGDQVLISIDSDALHPVGMVIDDRQVVVGCLQFPGHGGVYKGIDFGSYDLIESPWDSIRIEPSLPMLWGREDKQIERETNEICSYLVPAESERRELEEKKVLSSVLLEQMGVKFGDAGESISCRNRVSAAPKAQIERWMLDIVKAKSLGEIFGGKKGDPCNAPE